ncbi:MAG: SMP-30/gluconolactonase/LRE family protein [Betaproteobacteria bacterium]|nr:SMP-30/gluconolactonase/LRE family protein [Betaproteobacteria bacterium]
MNKEPELLAEGLGWAEGPAVLSDGRVCFVETYRSQVSVWERGKGVSRYSYTAGGPNSCVVGKGGAMYVCQNGGTTGPWRAEEMVTPSIQVIEKEGSNAQIICSEIEGIRFNGPNDLVFGNNGKLYFTDPGTYRPNDPQPSYLFELSPDGSGRLLAELSPPTFPNGIAIEADGSVVWAESYTGMVRRLNPDTLKITDICKLPGEKPVADGLAVAADGRLFVTTVNGGGIDVVNKDGSYDQFLRIGIIPTNCVFSGSDLYLTDAGVLADSSDPSMGGQLWLLKNVTDGLGTWPGSIRY